IQSPQQPQVGDFQTSIRVGLRANVGTPVSKPIPRAPARMPRLALEVGFDMAMIVLAVVPDRGNDATPAHPGREWACCYPVNWSAQGPKGLRSARRGFGAGPLRLSFRRSRVEQRAPVLRTGAV